MVGFPSRPHSLGTFCGVSAGAPLTVDALPGLEARLLHSRGWKREGRTDYESAGGYANGGAVRTCAD